MRLNNVLIVGIPKLEKENVTDIDLKIGQKIGVNITASDIDITHWLPQLRAGNSPTIIVKFVRRTIKVDFMREKAKLRNTNSVSLVDAPAHSIYLNEHLTISNRKKFAEARKQRDDDKFEFVWVKKGHICIREEEGKPAVLYNEGKKVAYCGLRMAESEDVGTQYFEGVEKLIEIWFIKTDGNSKLCDLRNIPRPIITALFCVSSTSLPCFTSLHLTALFHISPPHCPVSHISTSLPCFASDHLISLFRISPPHCPVSRLSTSLPCFASLHLTALFRVSPPHCAVSRLSTSLRCFASVHLTALFRVCPPHCAVSRLSTSLRRFASVHLTAPFRVCPPHCAVSRLSTSLPPFASLHLTAPFRVSTSLPPFASVHHIALFHK
uniref:FP protein C-terminal domain-containing protein n=1 Tax=Timema tahoe TaxID=61484 RepID=A0A7R9FKK9_9NEOP|nr:unnamed protein product [Timema tahoe]